MIALLFVDVLRISNALCFVSVQAWTLAAGAARQPSGPAIHAPAPTAPR
jgi:hypothetical protein